MRRTTWAALLLAAAPLGAAQEKPAWTWTGESRFYTIQTTAERKHAEEVLEYMDLCFQTYSRFLNPAPERMPKKKFNLILYTGVEEYKKQGGPGRYGHYDGRNLVGYWHENQMLPTFSHEGMHQFTDLCIPNFGRVPSWYSEGIAECIANNEVRKGKLYICLKQGPVPELRVPVIKRALLDGKHIPLKDLLDYDKRKFQQNHRLLYAEAWSFCHFLLAAPKLEDTGKQLPDGKYKQVLVKFHNSLLDPKMTPAQAATAAFRQNNRPMDLAKLEEEWKAYVLDFPYEAEEPGAGENDPAKPDEEPGK